MNRRHETLDLNQTYINDALHYLKQTTVCNLWVITTEFVHHLTWSDDRWQTIKLIETKDFCRSQTSPFITISCVSLFTALHYFAFILGQGQIDSGRTEVRSSWYCFRLNGKVFIVHETWASTVQRCLISLWILEEFYCWRLRGFELCDSFPSAKILKTISILIRPQAQSTEW